MHPEDEGRFRAVRHAVAGLALAEASRAVAAGRLVDEPSGEPFTLGPMTMVLPVSDGLRRRLESEDYERRAAEAEAGWRLKLAVG